MIFVKYQERLLDPATGAITYLVLGSELHRDIEEVLLPATSLDPIFFTKKFVGRPEHRWEVIDVVMDPAEADKTYVITLQRRKQLDKQFYLKNILTARGGAAGHVLHPWSVVEVEFGHALTVGKENGDIRTNKRYVDTMQRLSMPKRRLAIVNIVHPGGDELIQVIPITSKPPRANDKTMVEVTSCLTSMAHYQKPSWAVCRMIQTVTASRIIAPMIMPAPSKSSAIVRRDMGFGTQIRGAVRTALKDAMMYGVAAGGRVQAAQSLADVLEEKQQLTTLIAALQRQVANLKSDVRIYQRWAIDSGVTKEELRELFPE